MGLLRRLSGKESACQSVDTGDPGSILGSGRSPGDGNGNHLPAFLPGKSQGQRNLAGPGGHKEWATTGGLSATKPLSGRQGPAPLLIAGLQSQPSRRSQFPAQEVEEEDSLRPGPIPRRRPQCGSGPQGLGAAKSSAVRTGQHSH